jgi:Flp pilus assembly protein TadG
MRIRRKLASDTEGAAAMEFVIVAPALILLIVGLAQLGILFMANAGLRNAVAAGARLATIYPLPSDATLQQRITDTRFGLKASQLTTPTITHGSANGINYVDISASYSVPMNFVFFQLSPVQLTQNRRAFVTPAS